jgi:hypothetical protein
LARKWTPLLAFLSCPKGFSLVAQNPASIPDLVLQTIGNRCHISPVSPLNLPSNDTEQGGLVAHLPSSGQTTLLCAGRPAMKLFMVITSLANNRPTKGSFKLKWNYYIPNALTSLMETLMSFKVIPLPHLPITWIWQPPGRCKIGCIFGGLLFSQALHQHKISPLAV